MILRNSWFSYEAYIFIITFFCVRMFSEGGNYNWEEANLVSSELQRVANFIQKSEIDMFQLILVQIPESFVTSTVDPER